MEKYQNRYRIPSHRKPGWNYGGNGIYFITICTQNRECNLGTIKNGDMVLSDFGTIVHAQWLQSFEIRNELVLIEWVMMPNHIHAVIELNQRDTTNGDGDVNVDVATTDVATTNDGDVTENDDDVTVETHGRASLPPPLPFPPPSPPQPLPPQHFIPVRAPQSISSFLAGFKSAVNSKIDDYIDEHQLNIPKYNRNNHFFQSNYHDHIIRNQNELNRIIGYIKSNPAKWDEDKFFNQ